MVLESSHYVTYQGIGYSQAQARTPLSREPIFVEKHRLKDAYNSLFTKLACNVLESIEF